MKGMPSRPKGVSGITGTPKGPQLGVPSGYGMKHKLRKGTEFPGMDTTESGLADQMTDYARMAAAGGMGQ